jgi:hypothetical protein
MEVNIFSQVLIESQGYSIYGYIQSWIVYVLNQTWDYDLARLAMKFIGSYVPGEQAIRPWLTQQQFLQHTTRYLYMFSNSLVTDNRIA